jgi:hypothetical protein
MRWVTASSCGSTWAPIGERPFVNNASFGAYAAVVQSPTDRDDRSGPWDHLRGPDPKPVMDWKRLWQLAR